MTGVRLTAVLWTTSTCLSRYLTWYLSVNLMCRMSLTTQSFLPNSGKLCLLKCFGKNGAHSQCSQKTLSWLLSSLTYCFDVFILNYVYLILYNIFLYLCLLLFLSASRSYQKRVWLFVYHVFNQDMWPQLLIYCVTHNTSMYVIALCL